MGTFLLGWDRRMNGHPEESEAYLRRFVELHADSPEPSPPLSNSRPFSTVREGFWPSRSSPR